MVFRFFFWDMYHDQHFFSSKEHSFLELYLQSAFGIFALHSNSIAIENGDHMGINFLDPSAVCL